MTLVLRRTATLALSLAVAIPPGGSAAPADDETARIVHALNRLTFGARPGDVERVRSLGLSKWIELQLQPERIPDAKVAARLASLRTHGLATAELLKGYDIPAEAKREIKEKKAQLGDDASETAMRRARLEFMVKYGSRMEGPPRLVVDELQEAKLLRAVYAERQLDEVLVDFWINHFNVFAEKGPERFLVAEYEREAIRPHAWGRFEDLLKATAESPAMLFYLDNWLSADPNARLWDYLDRMQRRPGGRGDEAPAGRRRGLNENYAREVMELHTLGVDGGYTQKDVTEVARCFTGWTIRGFRPDGSEQDPKFAFVEALHDKGDKVVLGRTIQGGGKGEGDRVHMLATHPSTARFISTKLARRLVADEPPAALVERAAERFRRTEGDIRAVVTTIVTSPEFFAAEARGVKVKTPLEFVASALRATGADVLDARDLCRRLGEMGMPLYLQQPPTGYKDTADAWVSTSGLVARLNFAVDLAAGRIMGVLLEPRSLAPDAADAARAAGLVLGSPEFQRK